MAAAQILDHFVEVLPSEASLARWAVALAPHRITLDDLVLDAWDAAKHDPVLDSELRGCRPGEERQRVAIRYFGDLQNPQPVERSDWTPPGMSVYEQRSYRTPDWRWPGRRLPPLESLEGDKAPAAPGRHPGGAPLSPVMPVEAARRLQAQIDRILAGERDNGLTHAALARQYGISRHRIARALELRSAGYDLSESPPEFRADTGRDSMVRWPASLKPSKS